jgi:hypothetical protein
LSVIVPMSVGGVSIHALVQLLCTICIVYYGYRPVSLNKVYPRSFLWVQPSVFV